MSLCEIYEAAMSQKKTSDDLVIVSLEDEEQ
jgi:hypothetical protein